MDCFISVTDQMLKAGYGLMIHPLSNGRMMSIFFITDVPQGTDWFQEMKEEQSLEDPLRIDTLSKIKREPDEPGISHPSPSAMGRC